MRIIGIDSRVKRIISEAKQKGSFHEIPENSIYTQGYMDNVADINYRSERRQRIAWAQINDREARLNNIPSSEPLYKKIINYFSNLF